MSGVHRGGGVQSYGPALVVLLAAGVTLFAGPAAVRHLVHAQTSVDIVQASNRLTQGGNLLEELNSLQRDIARAVEPSVVHVSTVGTIRRRSMSQPYVSSGSGWVYDEAGHVITNAHVVDGADRVQVQLRGGELRDAKVVGLDLGTDVALLEIAPGGLHAARRGDSDGLQQGDLVYAFGSPFDFRFSMSSGIVSGLGRSAGLAEIDYQNFIQVDAAINPGNSGGPLTDIYGRVVGMNTAIATGRGNSVGQGQFAGIGLAIPMSMIENVVSQLIETGEVLKGYLGIGVDAPDSPLLGRWNDPTIVYVTEHFQGEGAVVTEVAEGSPAESIGLKVGDVILSIDGRKITGSQQVPAIISSHRPGTEVALEIWRAELDSGSISVTEKRVALGTLQPEMRALPRVNDSLERLGFVKLATATEERAQQLGVPFRRGVLVEEIDTRASIAEAIPPGSTIVEVLEQPIGSADEFYFRLNRYLENVRSLGPYVRVPITVVNPQGEARAVILPIG